MTCPHPIHYRNAAGVCRVCAALKRRCNAESKRRNREAEAARMRRENASRIERRELARLDGLRRVLNELVAEGLLAVEYDQEGAPRFAATSTS